MLSDRDYRLSMRISRRPKRTDLSNGLRSLLIHRLTGTTKAVYRVQLSKEKANVYCEGCDSWMNDVGGPSDIITCEHCGCAYQMEFAVYEEIK